MISMINSFVAGKVVSGEMYGCTSENSWVAHGFTDGDMNTSPYGDNQWALCVTCGAWSALTIWEHLLMGPVDSKSSNLHLLMRVITTFRGVANFFLEYMWEETTSSEKKHGNITMHTGPTTSPENTYLVLLKG